MNRLSKEAHAIEEINGVRCGVVEKNASQQRVDFLKNLLEYNGYTVMVGPSPPPKVAAKPATPVAEGQTVEVPPTPPATFTIGVTDVIFNPMLAVYELALKTPEGKIVSIDYWNQSASGGEKPGEYYWKRGFFTNSL